MGNQDSVFLWDIRIPFFRGISGIPFFSVRYQDSVFLWDIRDSIFPWDIRIPFFRGISEINVFRFTPGISCFRREYKKDPLPF